MIIYFFLEALFTLIGLLDVIVQQVFEVLGISIGGFTNAVLAIMTSMANTTFYLYGLFPLTAGMIYQWIFTYFIIWMIYMFIAILYSFVPRHKVVV